MLKNKILVFAIILSILMGINIVSNATTGEITGQTVKLREAASLDSKIVDLLSVTNKVEVLNQEGDWYYVEFKTKKGYVHKDYIKVEEQEEKEETTQEPTTAEVQNTNQQENQEQTAVENQEIQNELPISKVIKSDSDIYILPVITSSKLGSIPASKTITLIKEISGWGYISSEEFSGWIRVEKLEDVKKEEKVEEQPKVEEKKEEVKKEEVKKENTEKALNKKGYVNVDSLNVRKEKSTDSDKVTSLIKNSEVTVTAEDGEWYKIKVSSKVGYVHKKYISDKKVEVTNRSSEPRTANVEAKETNKETATANTNSELGSQVVAYAKQYLNYPYVKGGKGPKSFDCSGFTSYVYKNFGIKLGASSSAQRSNGKAVSKSELQPGDLVLFTGHVGIYIGNNQFIHAANPEKGVIITSLSDSYYKKTYLGARRVI